jgi:hypothetical protein
MPLGFRFKVALTGATERLPAKTISPGSIGLSTALPSTNVMAVITTAMATVVRMVARVLIVPCGPPMGEPLSGKLVRDDDGASRGKGFRLQHAPFLLFFSRVARRSRRSSRASV